MSWHIKPGHEHNFICGRTHQHHTHLVNGVTGGEHHLIMLLGNPTCPQCKRPFPQTEDVLDPHQAIQEALAMLNPNHERIIAYSKRHGIPIAVGPYHDTVPQGHRLVGRDDRKLLLPK